MIEKLPETQLQYRLSAHKWSRIGDLFAVKSTSNARLHRDYESTYSWTSDSANQYQADSWTSDSANQYQADSWTSDSANQYQAGETEAPPPGGSDTSPGETAAPAPGGSDTSPGETAAAAPGRQRHQPRETAVPAVGDSGTSRGRQRHQPREIVAPAPGDGGTTPGRWQHQPRETAALTMLMSSGPFTDIKFIPDSLATALARRVFPQPGGPARRTPAGQPRPSDLNCSGYLTGACKTTRRLSEGNYYILYI